MCSFSHFSFYFSGSAPDMYWHNNQCSFFRSLSCFPEHFLGNKCTQAIERYCPGSINERETRSCCIWNTETLWSRLLWCLGVCLTLEYSYIKVEKYMKFLHILILEVITKLDEGPESCQTWGLFCCPVLNQVQNQVHTPVHSPVQSPGFVLHLPYNST